MTKQDIEFISNFLKKKRIGEETPIQTFKRVTGEFSELLEGIKQDEDKYLQNVKIFLNVNNRYIYKLLFKIKTYLRYMLPSDIKKAVLQAEIGGEKSLKDIEEIQDEETRKGLLHLEKRSLEKQIKALEHL
jgi:hypothetical protein